MTKSTVIARILDGNRLECRVTSPRNEQLVLTGKTTDVEPETEGSPALGGNRALVNNAWAYAKFTYLKVSLPTLKAQKGAEKRAAAHQRIAEWIAGLADHVWATTRAGWCSGCFAKAEHRKANRPVGHLPAYLCLACGSATLPCASPRCDNMAARGRGAVRIPRYCAEHRHEIPGFEKADHKVAALDDYRAFLAYEKPDLRRTTKLAGLVITGAVGGAGLGYIGAEAIGGAVGALASTYSGAAATSYGLALLGGGSIASGGLGMAGGTLVVAVLGGGLGSAVGASVTNAYVREDRSFRITRLCSGDGVPVIVCNGFLTENDDGWGEWRDIVTTRYPDSPVYRVHWGSKELKDLGILAARGAVKVAGPIAIKKAAMAATKSGARRLGPLGPILFAAELAKNPWHVAKNRADKTGVVLADLLARTSADSYVLVGHSLGARAMVVAAQTLGTKLDAPRIEAVHLLGAAIGGSGDWENLVEGVDDAVYNYHSTNDRVLKFVYKFATAGQSAAGFKGFTPPTGKLQNIDVTAQVAGHSDYHTGVKLL
jgi:hypothetical protein